MKIITFSFFGKKLQFFLGKLVKIGQFIFDYEQYFWADAKFETFKDYCVGVEVLCVGGPE